MNQNWRQEIVAGAIVTSEHDDDRQIWVVIKVDGRFAWIRKIVDAPNDSDRGEIREAPFMFPCQIK